MAGSGKRPSFAAGAAVLTAAVAAVKLIGAVYKLPLNNILGGAGKTYFDTAYKIYNFLLTFSTAGLPLAISRLTSQAQARGLEGEKRRIFSTAIWLFFALGLFGSTLMFTQAQGLAEFLNNSLAQRAVRALAPAVFCVCMLACMRGYTQGQGNMTPTAVSQVLEALLKLGVGLPLAWYAVKTGLGAEAGAAGAILGVTAGTVASMLFLCAYLLGRRAPAPAAGGGVSPRGQIVWRILAIGIPITLSNSAMSIINIIDTKIVMGRLQGGLGLSQEEAAVLNGQYSMAMDMPNMVASFVYPVTMSLIPFAAAALARHDHAGAERIVSSALRIVAVLTLPAGVGLSVLSGPIERLVLPMQRQDALAAGQHLRLLGLALIFICLMILTNAILQTYGRETLPIFTVAAGGTVKVVMNYVLVGRPEIGIHGAPVSTLCCYLTICGLNLFFIRRYSPRRPDYWALFARPAAASVLMGGAAWAVHGLMLRFLGRPESYGAGALAALLGILAGVGTYGVLVSALGILRAEDVSALPKGEKIAKIFRLR